MIPMQTTARSFLFFLFLTIATTGIAQQIGFTGTHFRIPLKDSAGIALSNSWKATAWKGERVYEQVMVKASAAKKTVRIAVTDLSNGKGQTIPKQNIHTGFIGYTWTDEFRNGCGYRKSTDFDSSLVADVIRTDLREAGQEAGENLAAWISVQVPENAAAGVYQGSITVDDGKRSRLSIRIQVSERRLPPPAAWSYDLDLWQHPAAIARVHKTALWSDAHFAAMRPYYTMLAAAGQKTITASVVDEPWGHQTYDDYPSLIHWTLKKDGSWRFDYSLFDRYVQFVMDCGIQERIHCYSMVPWKIAFRYYDEALQRDTVFTGAIGTPAYNAFWQPMLTDFTRHLKEKNWFNRTAIAMDERPMDALKSVIALLQSIDPNWKIALAGAWHPEIEKDIYNYCIASESRFPDEVLKRRVQQGKQSTWYTCCTEKYPNGFSFSPPDEHVWLGWYTAATGMNGYLRWAYNSWPADPLRDSRFTAWPAGDTYQVYPGPLSSIRFEKMIEGIQDYEKIRVLQAEYAGAGENSKLQALQQALNSFDINRFKEAGATEQLRPYKALLNP